MEDITVILICATISGGCFIVYFLSGKSEIAERTRINQYKYKRKSNFKSLNGFLDYFFIWIKHNSSTIEIGPYEVFEYTELLERAGEPYELTPQDLELLKRVVSILTTVTTFILSQSFFDSIWIALMITITIGYKAGGYLTERQLRDIANDRCEKARENFLAIDLIGVCSGAGASPYETIKATQENEQGLFYDELRLMLRNIDNGMSFESALAKFVRRLPLPEIKEMAQIFIFCIQFGLPIESKLLELSAKIRESNKTKIAEKTARAESNLTLPMVFILLPCVLIIYLAPIIYESIKNFKF